MVTPSDAYVVVPWNGSTFCITGPLCGDPPAIAFLQRKLVMWSLAVLIIVNLNKTNGQVTGYMWRHDAHVKSL